MRIFLIAFYCLSSCQLFAATTAEDCKPKIDKARTTLLELMGGKKTSEQQAAVKDSANAADTCIMDIKAPAGKDSKLAELKKNWSAFKNTRETELVPLIMSGKDEEAKKVGTGIQAERIGKVKSLIQQLSEE